VLEVHGVKHVEIMGIRHFREKVIKLLLRKKYDNSNEKMRCSNKRGIY